MGGNVAWPREARAQKALVGRSSALRPVGPGGESRPNAENHF